MNSEIKYQTDHLVDPEIKRHLQIQGIHPDYYSAGTNSESERTTQHLKSFRSEILIAPKRINWLTFLGGAKLSHTLPLILGASLALVGVLCGTIFFTHFGPLTFRVASASKPLVNPLITSVGSTAYEDRFLRLSMALGQVVSMVKKHDAILTKSSPQLMQQKNIENEENYANAEVVRVSVPSANLRISPGKTSSAIMMVSEGTELLVEEKVGDWTRVISPNGHALWISNEVIIKNH